LFFELDFLLQNEARPIGRSVSLERTSPLRQSARLKSINILENLGEYCTFEKQNACNKPWVALVWKWKSREVCKKIDLANLNGIHRYDEKSG
jgi:hypothetical protein